MKLKDLFGKPVKNKKSGQTIVNLKKIPLKRLGLTERELFNIEVSKKLKKPKKINKKGQFQPFYLFMIAVIIFIAGFALASPLVHSSHQVRTDMNCSSSNLTTGQRVSCTTVDIIPAWVIGLILSIGGTAFAAKYI